MALAGPNQCPIHASFTILLIKSDTLTDELFYLYNGCRSQVVDREDTQFDILFVSSVLNLAEFLSLRPDLAKIPVKIIYFHENQLVYPIQTQKERDFQYGYNQFLSW